MKRIILIAIAALFFINNNILAQDGSISGSNVVTTGVPFLTIAPDSRAGAMGDAGVATSPDINSQHWNPAKYSFIKSNSGIALSYTPWLRSLISDMHIAYLAAYTHLDDKQTISAGLRYFDLGSVQYYDNTGHKMRLVSPNEYSIDGAYALKLSDNVSGSVALRYIRSDLFSGTEDYYAGNSFAADVSFFYTKDFRSQGKQNNMSYGINISNIGRKISYTEGEIEDFIPTNLRIGGAYTTEIDQYNKVMFTVDFNKLLVVAPENADANIGQSPQDIGPIEGMFLSFTDGADFAEELSEVTIGLGAEYWYSQQFAIRAGYFNEAKDKGNRKFMTFGAGLKMNVFSLDFSYIYTLARQSPLENTLRFSIGFDLEDFQKQNRR